MVQKSKDYLLEMKNIIGMLLQKNCQPILTQSGVLYLRSTYLIKVLDTHHFTSSQDIIM